MMQQAMEQGLRVGKVQRTVDELWRTTCYIVVLLSLIFLVMLVMDTLALRDTLDLRENLAAITVGSTWTRWVPAGVLLQWAA